MLKIPSKWSVWLSMALSVVFFGVCIAGAVVMPSLVTMLIDLPDNIGDRDAITETGRVMVLILTYMALAAMTMADTLLFWLLHRVRRGEVFTPASVSLVRGVSWCCFLLSAVFCGLGIYFQLAFIVAIMAVFLGLCLRVVKNVIEEATLIKSENDLTV